MFTLRPLTIVLPSREDKDHPAIDLDLHLPFFCFRPQQLLQVLGLYLLCQVSKTGKGLQWFPVLSLVSVGAGLSIAGTADCAIFCRLGQTHTGGRELVAFTAGQLKSSWSILK